MYKIFSLVAWLQKSTMTTCLILPFIAIFFCFFSFFSYFEKPMLTAMLLVYSILIMRIITGFLFTYCKGIYKILASDLISFAKMNLSKASQVAISFFVLWLLLVKIPEKLNFAFWLTFTLCVFSYLHICLLNNSLCNLLKKTFAKELLLEFKYFLLHVNTFLIKNKPSMEQLRIAFIATGANSMQILKTSIREIEDHPVKNVESFTSKIRESKPVRTGNIMQFKPDLEEDHLELITLTNSLLAEFKKT